MYHDAGEIYSNAKIDDVYLPFVIHILERLTPFAIAKECPGLNICTEWHDQRHALLIEIAEASRKSIFTYAIGLSRRNLTLSYAELGARDMYTATELCVDCETVKLGIYQYEAANTITYGDVVVSASNVLFVLDRDSIIS